MDPVAKVIGTACCDRVMLSARRRYDDPTLNKVVTLVDTWVENIIERVEHSLMIFLQRWYLTKSEVISSYLQVIAMKIRYPY